jgi:hypothetical protein
MFDKIGAVILHDAALKRCLLNVGGAAGLASALSVKLKT